MGLQKGLGPRAEPKLKRLAAMGEDPPGFVVLCHVATTDPTAEGQSDATK